MTLPNEITQIANLVGREAEKWLRTAGQGIFTAFDTGQAALDFFRSGYGAIRTQTFYQIRREVLSVSESTRQMSDLPDGNIIPMAWHNTEHGLNLSSEYEYRLHLFGYEPDTGAIKEQWIIVSSNRQLDKATVQETARLLLGEGGESGNMILERFGEIEPMKRT